ncbi:MAG: RNA polymerase factor sigma-32 [Xanthomonadaceae bacterium]|nr:RNA polymerase factor sigma-32 [Xanthomonadaceae bacterium]
MPPKNKKPLTPEIIIEKEPEDVVDSQSNEDDEIIELGTSPALPEKLEITEKEIATVGANDPIKQYLKEVQRYPLLSAEEEFTYANKLIKTGDLSAAKTLVSANLRLVVKIAFEYRSFYSNLLDLIQEGNVGLMKAVSKFDPTKGARLGYYSSWWIRSYILKYIIDNFRLVKLGTTSAQKKLFYHLVREKERMEAQGMFAAPKLLAEKLDVREKDVIEMQQRLLTGGAEVPLDSPMGDDSKRTFMDAMASQDESIEDNMVRTQMTDILHEQLPAFEKALSDKEKKVLHERLLAEEPKTLQEVADQYGLTRERARQIEAKVIEKLRNFLKPTLHPEAHRVNSSSNEKKKIRKKTVGKNNGRQNSN